MNIKLNDLVLEVGSGDKPYPRSDILLDKLPEDSSERESGRALVIDRPLVIGEAEALPFPDKSFDYIIASHVLEHAQDPEKMLKELSRVGKRGYLETPSLLREYLSDWPFHRWYIFFDKKGLNLTKKDSQKKLFRAYRKIIKDKLALLDTRQLPNLKYEWEGEIKFKIWESGSKVFWDELGRQLTGQLKESSGEGLRLPIPKMIGFFLLFENWGQRLKRWLYEMIMRIKSELVKAKRKKINWLRLLVCPACKGKLVLKDNFLICSSCRRKFSFYQQKNPLMLP